MLSRQIGHVCICWIHSAHTTKCLHGYSKIFRYSDKHIQQTRVAICRGKRSGCVRCTCFSKSLFFLPLSDRERLVVLLRLFLPLIPYVYRTLEKPMFPRLWGIVPSLPIDYFSSITGKIDAVRFVSKAKKKLDIPYFSTDLGYRGW